MRWAVTVENGEFKREFKSENKVKGRKKKFNLLRNCLRVIVVTVDIIFLFVEFNRNWFNFQIGKFRFSITYLL